MHTSTQAHTHIGICTHRHTGYTKLNLTQLKTYCCQLRKLSASFLHHRVTAPVPVATCGTLCVRWSWGRTSFLAWPCPPCATSRSGCWGHSASVTCPKWVSWLTAEDHVLIGLWFGFIRVRLADFSKCWVHVLCFNEILQILASIGFMFCVLMRFCRF